MKNARNHVRREGSERPHDAVPGGDQLMAQRLLAAFEHLRESIVLTDPEDRFLLTNRAFRDLNRNVAHAIQPGLKFEDYMRAGIAAGNYPDAVGKEEEWLAARLAERRNPGQPVERQRNEGRWFLIDDRRLPDGSTIRFGTEITERKRAEAALNDRNRDLQLVVDSVPVMITRLDRDERFLFANRAYTEMMELPSEDILGRRVADIVSPETYARIKPALNRALSGDPVSVHRIQPRANGGQIEIEGRYIPDVDVEGRVIGMFAVHRDVTAERRARESLARSEGRFRGLAALSSDWYWEQDAQFRYVYISEDADARGALGMKARAGKTRWELPWTGVTEAQWAAHRAQLEAHEVFHDLEIGRPGADGETTWVSVSGEPIFDADGRFAGYRGVTRNITARKAAEQLLRLEHQVTRALSDAENAAAGVRAVLRVVCEAVGMGCGRFFKLDEAAGVLRFHDGWCLPQPAYERFLENSRLLVFRPGEGLAGIIWETGEPIWSSDTSIDPRVLGKSLARNSDIRAAFAFTVRSAGKVLGVLSFSGQTARKPDDRMLQAARVIGSQTGQFLQRKLAEQALAASESRFRQTFEHAASGIAQVDLQGRFTHVNRSLCRILGHGEAELVGTMVRDFSHPEDHGVTDGARRRMHSGEIDSEHFKKRYLSKDGTTVWVDLTVAVVRDSSGKPEYEIAVFDDITEEVRARGRIERMNVELEERVETRTAELRAAMKELDAFTYSVSHDLRAPIGAVSGFAHLLRSAEAERLSQDGKRLLGFIEHNAERMTRLIEGLLRFSRLGRSELRRSRVSMNGLAAEALMDFVDESARADIRSAAMPDCSGDPALLGQVWANLLGNALKYSRGAGVPQIDIGWDAGQSAYFVRDNGIGFDMAYSAKLFGVFERLHAESEFEGSGIGLAIAERIVRLHGGAIWADAAPGRGATFWFTVPAAEKWEN